MSRFLDTTPQVKLMGSILYSCFLLRCIHELFLLCVSNPLVHEFWGFSHNTDMLQVTSPSPAPWQSNINAANYAQHATTRRKRYTASIHRQHRISKIFCSHQNSNPALKRMEMSLKRRKPNPQSKHKHKHRSQRHRTAPPAQRCSSP